MARTIWSTEETALLIEKYPVSSPQELKVLLPTKTYPAIRSKARNLRLTKAKKRFLFSEVQIEEVKQIYPTTLCADIAKKYGCSIHTVHNLAFRLGLKKNIEFIKAVAREKIADPAHPARKYWKKKGEEPANKGKKWSEFMSAEGQSNSRTTCFKKGNIPKNHEPVGTIKEVKKDGYLKKKIAEPNKWQLLHRLVWEAHNGPIPKGYNIQFRDGNRKNCAIGNLYMIDRNKQMLQNSGVFNLPDKMVASYIAGKRGKNKHLIPAILENKGLIEAKRQQILLNREIRNTHEKRNSRNESKTDGR